MRSTRGLSFAVASLVAIGSSTFALAPRVVRAQEPTQQQIDEARRLFEQGLEYSDRERWGEALEYFRRSRAIAERPSTVYNMAVTLYRLGRLREAAESFEAFLGMSSEESDPERHREARRQLEVMRQSLAHLTLEVGPPDARVDVDGTVVAGTGATREMALDPGEHRVTVTADGYEAAVLELSVLPGGREQRRVVLARDVRPATLTITSDVSDAVIRVDDETVGTGEARVAVAPGRHRIHVRASDRAPFERVVEVGAGANLHVNAGLGGETGGIFSSPWFWVVTGVVVTGATIGLVVALSSPDDPLAGYDGTTGVVIRGLVAR